MESTGLFALSSATTHNVALSGTGVSGCGFALVFPALGIEALKTVADHDHGAALGSYTTFLDWAMGITGPIAGFIVRKFGTRRFSSMAQELRPARVCSFSCSITSFLSRTHACRPQMLRAER